MPFKNVGLTIYLKAWDNDNQTWKTGDSANITARGVGDGTEYTPAGSVSEIDATNFPGLYKITLTNAENNYDVNAIGGKSSTAYITIHGMEWINIPIDFNATQKASINTEADTALSDIKLDHLLKPKDTDWGTTVEKESIIDLMTSKDTNQTFDRATDSQEAARDKLPANLEDMSITDTTGLVDTTQTAADKVWSTTARTLTDKTGFTISGTKTTLDALSGTDADTLKTVSDQVDTITGIISDSKISAQIKGMDTDTLTAAALKTDAVNEITAAIWAKIADGTITFEKTLKLIIAFIAGNYTWDGSVMTVKDQAGATLFTMTIADASGTGVIS